ncbi:MAG: riboflavin synthase subunit alpha [Spirochaetes bacterium GWB1_27_13]|nr:MAG: riboflavin synthase subunit alpha [Spirochaetes bacterium GWB1_27_13]
MFTGLVEEVGILKSLNNGELVISCSKVIEGTKIGDSISINGVCLSVTKIMDHALSFHTSPTTQNLSRFKLGDMRIGEKINLERALTPSTRLGGHIVSGHIDGKVKIISIEKTGGDYYFEFLFSKELKNFIIAKGSVCLDGISLTISKVMTSSFVTTIIPQTIKDTNLLDKKVGDFVHIEVDIFARYINHILNIGGISGENREIIEKFF